MMFDYDPNEMERDLKIRCFFCIVGLLATIAITVWLCVYIVKHLEWVN